MSIQNVTLHESHYYRDGRTGEVSKHTSEPVLIPHGEALDKVRTLLAEYKADGYRVKSRTMRGRNVTGFVLMRYDIVNGSVDVQSCHITFD